jgi:hypothetical protein
MCGTYHPKEEVGVTVQVRMVLVVIHSEASQVNPLAAAAAAVFST